MDIHALSTLPRRGNLLLVDSGTFKNLLQMASSVEQDGEFNWNASTAAEAAAWLLLLGHYNCCLDRHAIPGEWLHFPRNLLLTFRGQRAKYDNLRPTLWRMSDEQRHRSIRSVNWFHVVVNIWFKSSFRWSTPPNFWFGLDRKDTFAIAQHYSDVENGLGTDLIDWTWNPFVALAFAMDSTMKAKKTDFRATALMRPVTKSAKDQVILPPSGATRVWRQSGLFQSFYAPRSHERTVFCDRFGIRSIVEPRPLVESYPRISFPVDESAGKWAAQQYSKLMHDDSPFPAMATWSRLAAEQITGDVPERLMAFPDLCRRELEEIAIAAGMRLPETIDQVHHEDIEIVQQYAEDIAIRSRDGKLGVDEGAVAMFCEGVGGGCSHCWDSQPPQHDTQWVKNYLRNPEFASRLRARVRLRHPLLNWSEDEPWYKDEWDCVDLFRPFSPTEPC